MISKIVTLGDVCNKGSSNIAQKDLVDRDGIYPIYGAAGYIKNVDFAHQDKPYLAVVKDGAGIGRVMKLPANSSIIGTMQYILPKGNIDIDYLYFALQYMNLSKYFSGSTIPHIYFRDYQKEKLPLPELSEQQGKAYVLLRIEQLIECYHQQLTKLDELVKSRFIELFAGVEAEDTLQNLCTFIDYRGKTPEKVESGLPFITAKNIRMHHMSFDTLEYISKETYDRVMTRGFPQIGDVVFTTEAPLGNVCRIPFIETEFYIGQRIITMQTERLEPAYLEYALSSDEFKRKIAEKSSGSTVTGIRSKLLEQLTIPVPPRAQQQQFAAFVEQTDKSKLVVHKSLEKLETLKKALMQKYFG